MSDLISRSALIEAITQHSKDVKSDVPMVQDIYQIAHQHIIQLIEIQPTAYDVEKVVKELEEMKNIGSATKTEILITKACINRAIDIVKRGGVE